VISGGSGGGRLSLVTGMVTSAAGFDQDCPGQDEPRPAAIINYYGVTGLARAVEEKSKPALAWLRGPGGRLELARRLSPLTCVREGLPPVLTLHGDAGETVPYQGAVRLHRALDARAGPRPGLSSPPATPCPAMDFPVRKARRIIKPDWRTVTPNLSGIRETETPPDCVGKILDGEFSPFARARRCLHERSNQASMDG